MSEDRQSAVYPIAGIERIGKLDVARGFAIFSIYGLG
jgi:uncharacterized membrane protein YeiB